MSNALAYTTEEVARLLRVTRLTVYALIKRGELQAYRVGNRRLRVDAAEFEDYINKVKNRIPGKRIISPADTPLPGADKLIIGGEDATLGILLGHLGRAQPEVRVLRSHINDLAGLTALYYGKVSAVAAHLWDQETNSYNIPYARRLLPGRQLLIINLVEQRTGFYVAPGNPQEINTWQDLTGSGVRFVNRELGSGPRVLLDEKLRLLAINPGKIAGYGYAKMSDLAVAGCVTRGEADVGLGTETVARQMEGIDFIPVQKERYDLIVPKEDAAKPYFQMLLSILRSRRFHSELACLGCYDLTNTGKIVDKT